MRSNGYAFTMPASELRMARALDALAQPMTALELAERLCCEKRTALAYIRELLAQERIHVADWRQNCPGSPSPVYLVGNLPSKRKPKPLTGAQRERRWLEKNPEAALARTLAKRLQRQKTKRSRDVAALFGAA